MMDVKRGSESSANYGMFDAKIDNVPSVVNSPNKLDSQRFDQKEQKLPMRDQDEEDKEESKYLQHNENGKFPCSC